jgi:FtsH-binding integral membrane protein
MTYREFIVYEIIFAVLIFVVLVVASLGTLMTYGKLPTTHRQEDTNSVVRLIANIFVVMTSLVLGLMINSADNTFEATDRDVQTFATEVILLDRKLRDYGTETADVRQRLIAFMQHAIKTPIPINDPLVTGDRTSERLLDDVGTSLSRLKSTDPERGQLLATAHEQQQKLVQQHWAIVEHTEGTIPAPLIIMLAAWLVLIFASFGYRAPRNAIVVTMFIVASFLISTTLYLILDMDVPFSGPIQVSYAPLRSALAELQR